MKRTLSSDHVAIYPDPIQVAAGEPITLTGREIDWDGFRWVWAAAKDNREGWIPDTMVAQADGAWVATSDYSAVELTCAAGDTVELLREMHGWAWCRNQDGLEGWLPCKILSVG